MSTIKTGTTLTTAYQVVGDTTGALVIQTGATPTTALTIDTSQNVGIGTSSPSKKLEIGALGALRLQTGSVTMDCTPTAGGIDGFVWNVSAGYYAWSLGGATKMILDANGNVGIGTGTPTLNTSGTVLHINNSTAARAAITHYTNAESGAGAAQGLIVGKWENGTNYLFDYGNYPIIFGNNSTNRLTITTAGNLQFNTANAGIIFNKTGALNNSTLNDYEEGTWTPTMESGGTMNSVAFATYVKIGRLVTVNCYFNCTPTNNASNFTIGGIPFVNNGAASNYTAGTLGYTGSLNASAWHGPILTAGGNSFYFHQNNSTAVVLNSAFGGAANEIIVSISYHTA